MLFRVDFGVEFTFPYTKYFEYTLRLVKGTISVTYR